MIFRDYRSEDGPVLAGLLYDTVHLVNARDYTAAQLAAWAPAVRDLAAWDRSFRGRYTVVVEEGGCILGFGDLDPSGYLDRLYVHHAHQGRGIGTAICSALEAALPGRVITTCASITARPFFEGRGYVVLREQEVERAGVLLTNYSMERRPPDGVLENSSGSIPKSI